MPIEVRQMVIQSRVGSDVPATPGHVPEPGLGSEAAEQDSDALPRDREALRELCRDVLRQLLQDMGER